MLDNAVLEFEAKNDLLLYGYERGLSPVEWHKLDLPSFLDTLFQRGKGFEECFEETRSLEYNVWRSQADKQKQDTIRVCELSHSLEKE